MLKNIANKRIVFKLREFPHLSETFIIAQIITAIKLRYEVRILTDQLLDVTENKHEDLLDQYNLLDKVIIEDYKVPKNKFLRLVKWSVLLMSHIKDINQIIQFHKEQIKFSLTWLYQWVFYKQFNKVAVFHVQYGTNSTTLAKLKKIGYKPSLVVTFHGHDAFFPINGFIPNEGYYDNLFQYGDVITVNTPYLEEQVLQLGCPEDKMNIIPVGVDTDFFYPKKEHNLKNGKLKLITVGRLNRVKGHIYAFEVVSELKKLGYNIELTVIGEGSERMNLEKNIAENNLHDSINLVGAKTQEQIRDLHWRSDVFLFTSVSLHYGSSTETQGLATIEAMACGLPVVVFDSGGVKYTVEDGKSGFVCDEYDILSMVSKVKLLIGDVDLVKKMGNGAVDFVNKNYAQNVIDTKWEIIYSDLSNGK